MRILLFCENKYAISILSPIQEEADKEGGNECLWYVHQKRIPDFPLDGKVKYTFRIDEAYKFNPEAIFCPGNIVPYYLPGVKIQVFHGYAAEKKDHWVIRRYFDTYFTQGPFFTKGFERLAKKYGDFEVLETGWPRQDWIFNHRGDYDSVREDILQKHHAQKIVLYAPTFSPKLTSLPYLQDAMVQIASKGDSVVVCKFHPLTAPIYIEQYKKLAQENENIIYIDDHELTKYILMADVMVSDTSSALYEMLLMDKPVVTLRNVAKEIFWMNVEQPEDVPGAVEGVFSNDKTKEMRRWVIENYDPYLDGQVAHRMLEGARDYIRRHGVPPYRKLNLWRKYTSIKTFGRLKK